MVFIPCGKCVLLQHSSAFAEATLCKVCGALWLDILHPPLLKVQFGTRNEVMVVVCDWGHSLTVK